MVKMYNQTAAALVEFESVYHAAWMDEVSKLDYGWFFGSDLIYCSLLSCIMVTCHNFKYFLPILLYNSLEYYTAGSSPKDWKISCQL